MRTNMIFGWILIVLGILFALFGIGGSAKVSIGGKGGFTLVFVGAGGIAMIIVGVIVLGLPDIAVASFILPLVQ